MRAEDTRTKRQIEAESLGFLLGLHVWSERLLPDLQAYDELTAACMTTAAVVFDDQVDYAVLRNLVTSVPTWTFPDDDLSAQDVWVVDFVRAILADIQ
jgi:hypothetical protein